MIPNNSNNPSPVQNVTKAGSRGVTIFIIAIVLLTFFVMYSVFIGPALQDGKIQKNGIPAKATIISAEQTGSYYNNNPVIDFQLEVDKNGEKYNTSYSKLVMLVDIPSYSAGKVVDIKIDPNDKNAVAFVTEGGGTASIGEWLSKHITLIIVIILVDLGLFLTIMPRIRNRKQTLG